MFISSQENISSRGQGLASLYATVSPLYPVSSTRQATHGAHAQHLRPPPSQPQITHGGLGGRDGLRVQLTPSLGAASASAHGRLLRFSAQQRHRETCTVCPLRSTLQEEGILQKLRKAGTCFSLAVLPQASYLTSLCLTLLHPYKGRNRGPDLMISF